MLYSSVMLFYLLLLHGPQFQYISKLYEINASIFYDVKLIVLELTLFMHVYL